MLYDSDSSAEETKKDELQLFKASLDWENEFQAATQGHSQK